jgi:5-carboxymethyl-2-hydroxymuconate isomerase
MEYTKNLNSFDADEILALLNVAVFETGHFEETAIKSRAIELKHFALGTIDHKRRFLAVKVAILQGRSVEVRKDLANRLMNVLKTYLKNNGDKVAASVEITEIVTDTYVKQTLS